MGFSIYSKNENGFNKVILEEKETGTSAVILPSFGACLHAFTLLHQGNPVNIIDHYANADDLNKNLTAGFKSCKLSPFACRIKNATYQFGTHQYSPDKFLLNNSAMHGLLYDAVFEITQQQATQTQAQVVLQHAYRASNKGYPFNYDCIITYTLKSNNELTLATTIINRDEGLIPMQDGWHPYFTFGNKINELQLEFQSLQKILFDADMVPAGEMIAYTTFNSLTQTGDKQFDDCFLLNFAECQPMCVLRDTAQKLQLEIYPDNTYPYLQIYTPAHRNSIAIENLSAAPDAFNNGIGLITLAPQEKTNFTTTYKITPL